MSGAALDGLAADPLEVVLVASRDWNEDEVELLEVEHLAHSLDDVLNAIITGHHDDLVLTIFNDLMAVLQEMARHWVLEGSGVSDDVVVEQVLDDDVSSLGILNGQVGQVSSSLS